MFSFMKKDKEKDKEKKAEKLKKKEKDDKDKKRDKKERQNMTPEEITRLEEMKKGVVQRKLSDRRTERMPGSFHGQDRPSMTRGADHLGGGDSGAAAGAHETQGRGLTKPKPLPRQMVTNRPSASPPPAVKPKPKVKSILKGQGPPAPRKSVDLDDSELLMSNTRRNEDLFTSSTASNTTQSASSPMSTTQGSENFSMEASSTSTTPSTPGKDLSEYMLPEEEEANSDKPEPDYISKLKLPQIIPMKPSRIREIIVKRNQSGGFGFSLRKGLIPVRGGGLPNVVTFAEPGSGPSSRQTGLMPGDRLIEVNSINIEEMSREEIVEIIKKSNDTLTVKVQPIPELIELSVRPNKDGTTVDIQESASKSGTLRRSGSLRFKKEARSEDDVKSEQQWLETEKVWLLHRGGFTEVFLLRSENASLQDGRVRVKLDNGDVIEVDEDDIEKSNPPQFDRVEELACLRYLNESSALHTLRQRYASNLIHTYSGPHLLVINPLHQLPLYAEKVIQMLKGCKQEDMPPHIFSKAQMIYREMLNSRRDQSLLFLGRSGSGKTTNAQHVMHYLITAAGAVNSVFTNEKLASVYTLLQAFGNSRTSANANASRFTHIVTIDFDHSGLIGSASVQALMFEKTRVVRRPEGEPTFSIFYQLLAGVEGTLRNDLHLQTLSESNLFMTPPNKPEDKQRASEAWSAVIQAFETLNFSPEEVKAILCVLAAIYHLGNAGATRGNANRPQFAKPAAAQRAATLLGTTAEELAKSIFSAGATSTLNRSTSLRVMGAMDKPAYHSSDASATALDCLEGFVIGLYSEVFGAVVSIINRSLSSNVRSLNSITIVDSPGFQSTGMGAGRQSATFEDLCHNYTQERLQAFFNEITLASPLDRYNEENIELDFELDTINPTAMVSLLDKTPPQGIVRSSISDLKNVDKKGLLWLLDEEAMFPGATEDSFMERLLQHHAELPIRKDSLLRKGSLGHTFVLSHNQGTTSVQYNAHGWLKACRENPVSKNATLVLQDSKKSAISQLFTSVKGQAVGIVGGSIAGMEGSTSLKRVGSMRRTFVSGQAGLKKKSICLQVKFNVDSVLDILKKTTVHFVHCLLPHHSAGLGGEQRQLPNDDGVLLNIPFVRHQLRGFQVLEALRLFRQGFPDSMPFTEFNSRFEPLVPGSKAKSHNGDERMTSLNILGHLDVDKLNYRVGASRVFFRAGCISQLDLDRDEKFTGVVEHFQAMCRGYLGRKKFEKLQIQHKAIRCIQRNVRRYVHIKEWQWWKLYTKVKPILNVHRTEEELREREAEIETLKARNEKLEKERTEYKTQCDKLENRLAEVTADLAEENTTSNEAAELLEAETSERLRLEKELRDLQNKSSNWKRQNEKLQMEVMQTRLWQAESLDDEMGEDKEEDSVYKPRYERLLKELQMTKKQLQQQHEEEMEQELQSRKLIERKLHEAVAEAEEQRRQVQVGKKKIQRLTAEAQDTKLHLEEQMSRTNELERKQRRFDSELSMAQEDVKEEKTMREKLQRERDELLSEKYTLEQNVQQVKMDLESQQERCERLDKEMNDLLLTGKDNNEVVSLKRGKHELESKLQEQEEELDDQAGQIQQLEQAKLRLEMNMEKSKQQHSKDLEEKDEEIEEMRYKTQKKLRQLESQLEEEYEMKKRALEEKGQLERKLLESGSREPERDNESEKRLKRNLRKTRALLNDAGSALMRQKDSESAKSQIAALRNQLEDAKFTSAAAVKAKKRMELEMVELQQQIEESTRAKQEAEGKVMTLMREKADLHSQVEDNEEDMNDVMKKYKAAVQQQSVDQITLNDQTTQIEELLAERDQLRLKLSDQESRLESFNETTVDKHAHTRLETKLRDVESRLQLEMTTRQRQEANNARLKEQIDRLTSEKDEVNQTKVSLEESGKRLQKQLRELREEFGETQKKELEASHKKKELETRVEELEGDQEQNQSDLKLALKRITDLQAALEEDLDSDSDALLSDSEDNIDDEDDDLSDEEDGADMTSFLSNHKRGSATNGGHARMAVKLANSHHGEVEYEA